MPRQHPQRNYEEQLSLCLMLASRTFSLHAHTHTQNILRTFPTPTLVFALGDFRWKRQGQNCGLSPEWALKEREREMGTVKEEGERLFRWVKRQREGKRIFTIPAVQLWPARQPRRLLESWLEECCCIHGPCTCQMGGGGIKNKQ